MPLDPVTVANQLADAVDALRFAPPVSHVYNPLRYAAALHGAYLRRFGSGRKRVLFLGMNPGPWGMAQTGVPFGEVAAVRDWMGLTGEVAKPLREHPQRPVEGLACPRSEVSGRRLWGAFADRYGTADAFFAEHLVLNYCPLSFMSVSGANLTPDKLPEAERAPLLAACDAHLRTVVAEIYRPEWLIGIGAWARTRAEVACARLEVRCGQILHPSPASPVANRGWAAAATKQLFALGVWR